jgi:hypothetical protein
MRYIEVFYIMIVIQTTAGTQATDNTGTETRDHYRQNRGRGFILTNTGTQATYNNATGNNGTKATDNTGVEATDNFRSPSYRQHRSRAHNRPYWN